MSEEEATVIEETTEPESQSEAAESQTDFTEEDWDNSVTLDRDGGIVEPDLDYGDGEEDDEPETEEAGEDDDAAGKHAEDETDTDEAAKVAGSEIDEQLVACARVAGLREEEIKGFTPERLEAFLWTMAERGNQPGTGQAATPAQQPAQQAPTEMPSFEVDLDPNEYDEGMIKGINSALGQMRDFYNSQLQQVSGVLSNVAGQLQSGEMAKMETRFDEFVRDLPEGYKEHLGSGSVTDIDPNGAAMIARRDIFQRGLQMAGNGTAADLKKAWRISTDGLYGEKVHGDAKKEVRSDLKKSLKKRSAQFVGRPTNRKTTTPDDPDKGAASYVGAFLKKRGLGGDEEIEEEF